MTRRREGSGPPSLLYTALESRALLEGALLTPALPLLLSAPRGDGHPVLLIPGFVADSATLIALRAYLAQRGHEVVDWGLGRNVGFQRRHVSALEQTVRHLHHAHGRKLSIVGWSLGGVFGLYIAHRMPECVRALVTLGSPVSADPQRSDASAVVKALYRLVAHPLGPAAHSAQARARLLRRPPPVPTSCLYSLTDGVVPPHEATLDGDPVMHENIRVPGSHVGLGFNALAMWVVAERLAQSEGGWAPFAPSGFGARLLRWMTPASLPT